MSARQFDRVGIGPRFLGLAVIISLLLVECPASAGRLDLALEEKLKAIAPDELIQVVIRPSGSRPVAQLRQEAIAQYPTRAEQHRAMITALKSEAEQVQPALLAELHSDYYRGRVDEPTGFWIDNVITAMMTPSAVAEMAGRSDVEEILLMPEITLAGAPCLAGITSASTSSGAEPGLRAIKADSLWALGYTGAGRLIASIDAGVDGKHPLLFPKWRGHNGYTLGESWFDPVYGDTLPRTYSGLGMAHGTNVMGIMVAVLPVGSRADTLGVCPDCQWISAAAIVIPCPTNPDANCGNLFAALQWIADPDGDPNTESDVPDAVACPWGAVENPAYGCPHVFWNAIDNIEAAGAAMVFAAGNYNSQIPFSGRVWNPGNRNTSEVNSFSVGMVNGNQSTLPLDPLSSRGPSTCDNITVKPEVVAPGVSIRTTSPNQGITSGAYGTSFSMAHVAGAIPLLRQYSPNATVDQIKTALLFSARDLGTPGPDNDYGHGFVDLMGAIRLLPPNDQPALYLWRDYYDLPAPGTSADLVILLRSSGASATGVSVTLLSDDPRVTIVDGTAPFGNLPAIGDTSGNFAHPFVIAVAFDALPGERLPVHFEVTADGGYARSIRGAVQVGPALADDMFTHDAGNFRLTISSSGMFGRQIDGMAPHRGRDGYGVGYLYDGDPTQTLFEGAFLVGTDASHVSDNARIVSEPDADFRVDPGGRLEVTEPGTLFAEQTRSAFSDAPAEHPLGLFIEQRTWVSDDPVSDDYLIVQYTIHNRSGAAIPGLRAGLFFDWDFPWGDAGRDGGGFSVADGVGWMRDRTQNRLRGLAVVSAPGMTAHHYFSNPRDIFDGFSDYEKWAAMSEGFAHALPDRAGDGSHLIATGPFTIARDSQVTAAFAIIGATSEADLLASARDARLRYAQLLALDVDILPGACPNEISTAEPRDIDVRARLRVAPRSSFTVAVLGRPGKDIGTINPASARFVGLAPVRFAYADVGAPVVARESGPCECRRGAGDGYLDLQLEFDRAAVLEALQPVSDGEVRQLVLTALTRDGIHQSGIDCLMTRTSPPVIRPVAKMADVPLQLSNAPNPFNAATSISYHLNSSGPTRLEILDVLGRRVTTLVDEFQTPGAHTVTWQAVDAGGWPVPSGVYFCRLAAGGTVALHELVVLK